MLKGNHIFLRLIREKDLNQLYDFRVNLENRGPFFPLLLQPEPLFIKEFKETGFWSEGYGRFLIVNEQDEILGSIWYIKVIPYFSALEISYIIYDPTKRNQGIMTEALQLFCNYLFSIKNINRLELRIFPNHHASEKVALKCGFSFEGTARKAFFHHGNYVDINNYSLIRSEALIDPPG